MTQHSHYPQINGQSVVIDPGKLMESVERSEQAGKPGYSRAFWGLANSITNPIGMDPGVAWFTTTRSFHDGDNVNAHHVLGWNHSDGGTFRLINWVVHKTTCLAPDGDLGAAYLIEFRDRRQVLSQSKPLDPEKYEYNIPQGHYTGSSRDYWPATTNGAALWTWQEMFNELWSKLPAVIAGPTPALVWTPSHDPENWRFHEMTTWEAIGRVLDALQSTLVLEHNNTFRVIALGDDQADMANFANHTHRLIYDAKPKADANLARNPETLRICFQKGKSQEHCPPRPIQHEEAPTYSKDVATGLVGAQGGTVLPVWSDLLAEVDHENNMLNQAECDAAAGELGLRIKKRLDVPQEPFQRQYSGLIIEPWAGDQVHVVRWRDFGDKFGLMTEFEAVPAWGRPTNAVVQIPRKHPTSLLVQFLESVLPCEELTISSGICNVIEPVGAITPRVLSSVASHDGVQRVRVFNLGCDIVPVGCILPTWLLEDGTRYVKQEKTPERKMVRAMECIKPGDVDKCVMPQVYNLATKCWEDDEDGPILIDNGCGWILALCDDIFPVEPTGVGYCICDCEVPSYVPAGPFGLTRRVKIEDRIDCLSCGEVIILQGGSAFACPPEEKECPQAVAGENGVECPDEEGGGEENEPCKVQACNHTNRNLACDAEEYATLHIAPGPCKPCDTVDEEGEPVAGEWPDCVGWLEASTRPLHAQATLTACMCGGAAEFQGIMYKDVCLWDDEAGEREEPKQASNPLGLYGCEGDKVKLVWNDLLCSWEVANVQVHTYDNMVLDIYCVGCDIMVKRTKAVVAVQQCCDDCDEIEEIPAIPGYEVTVTSIEMECNEDSEEPCVLSTATKTFCVFCLAPEEGTGGAGTGLEILDIEVPSGMTVECDSGGSGSGDETCYVKMQTKKYCVLGCDAGDGEDITIDAFASLEVVEDVIFRQNGLSLEVEKCLTTICVLCHDDSADYCETDVVGGTDCQDES